MSTINKRVYLSISVASSTRFLLTFQSFWSPKQEEVKKGCTWIFCLFSGVPWWMEAKVENNKMYKYGIENGGKGWEKSQSNLRERSINYMEREVQPYRSSTPLLFRPAMETPDEIICKRVKLPKPKPLILVSSTRKSPETVYNFIRKQQAPQLGLCPQYA